MNSLFHEHPELVRSLGVHKLVLELLQNYLGIDTAVASKDKRDVRRLKSWAKYVSTYACTQCMGESLRKIIFQSTSECYIDHFIL